jgi:hypothetical protein
MPASAKARRRGRRARRCFFRHPRESGGPGPTVRALQHWIPAFAGMTGGADHPRLDALAGAEEVDRPLFAARGKLCGKSRARSAATGIEAPPSVDVFLLVEGLA